MYKSELETGILRGKRQTMMSVSSWVSEKVELARSEAKSRDCGLVLELTLGALESLLVSIDRQVAGGVNTIDCSDFLPK